MNLADNKSYPFLQHYPFVNIPLLYEYGALEPLIDTETMRIHHDLHLGGYINSLNLTLRDYPEFHTWTLERLIYDADQLPDQIREATLRYAGGVYNHFFYFEALTPSPNHPEGEILSLINDYFGSLDMLVKELNSKGMSVFGSGYAWLVVDMDGMLKIITTANQDTPLPDNMFPLLNMDVWEHAYYLLHQNRRMNYIENFIQLINWRIVNNRISKLNS